MSSTLKHKSVLITGAGRGIGKRLAMGFAEAGARVGLLARSQAELDLAKLEIEQAGGTAIKLRADVRKKFVLAGFGVGYSWGALAFAPEPFLVIPPFVLGQ